MEGEESMVGVGGGVRLTYYYSTTSEMNIHDKWIFMMEGEESAGWGLEEGGRGGTWESLVSPQEVGGWD